MKKINAKKEAATAALREKGAELLKQEDRFGETKSGWWLDGTFLAPASQPENALRVITGD